MLCSLRSYVNRMPTADLGAESKAALFCESARRLVVQSQVTPMRAIRYYSQAPRAGARVAPRGAAPARRCSWQHRRLWMPHSLASSSARPRGARHIAREEGARRQKNSQPSMSSLAAIRPAGVLGTVLVYSSLEPIHNCQLAYTHRKTW